MVEPVESRRAVPTVTPSDLAARRAWGERVDLVDVRTPVEYAEVHAEGARSIPLDRLDPRAVMAGRDGGADEPLYLICRSGGRSIKAAERFRAEGFDNLVSVAGGTAAWEQAGLPTVRGARKVVSLERQVRIGAGSLVILGLLLSWIAHPAFSGLSAFVGAGLVFAGVTNWCGMGLLLAKMPWNRATVG